MNLRRPVALAIAVFVLVGGSLVLRGLFDERGGSAAAGPPSRSSTEGSDGAFEIAAARPVGEEAPEREAAPVGDPGVPTGHAPRPGGALLEVVVVSGEDGVPLPEVRLVVAPANEGYSAAHADGSVGEVGVSPKTNAAGEAWFHLDPGSYQLFVGTDDRVDQVKREVSDLAAGEVRSLRVAVTSSPDLPFHGRVVDDLSGEPVPGAIVQVIEGGRLRIERDGSMRSVDDVPLTELATDADGRFEVRVRSWKRSHAAIDAPGYAVALAALAEGHSSPERAFTIRVQRPATLLAFVLEAGGPASGVDVRLKTDAYHLVQKSDPLSWSDPGGNRWQATTGVEGSALFGRLPAQAPLEARLWRDGRLLRKVAEPVVLRAGDDHEVTWSLGLGCRLSGVARTETGEPVADLAIWLDGATQDRQRYFQRTDAGRVVDKTRTDADGRFAFEDVPAGAWWVGPGEERAYRAEPTVHDPAPLPVRIQVHEGELEREVAITVHRGLYIRGTTVAPDGQPVPRTHVYGSRLSAYTQSDDEGAFALGPLAPGEYRLFGGWTGSGSYSASDKVTAYAGDDGVVVRLKPGGSISGTVADPAGAPARGWIMLGSLATDWQRALFRTSSIQQDGTFSLDGLAAGTYTLFAKSGDTITPGSRITLAAGEAVTDVSLTLEPGARLKIRCAPSAEAKGVVIVLIEDARVDVLGWGEGYELDALVPPGRCTLQWIAGPDNEVLDEAQVTAVVGQVTEVVLGD